MNENARCSRATPRTRRKNAKSGCITCKIRKVKCDEGKPACRRCVSTGRACDGYGVWGGGGGVGGNKCAAGRFGTGSLLSINAPVAPHAMTAQEGECFEWFRLRTSLKLPGIFMTTFWECLVFQASSEEPAVFHAVLALGSSHKRATLRELLPGRCPDIPDEQEQFTLKQYTKEIRHLGTRLQTKGRSSLRVALISCVVFICLELLQGHHQTAEDHLRNGVRLLEDLRRPTPFRSVGKSSRPVCDSTDDWIEEAFARLEVQVRLFQSPGQRHCLLPSSCTNKPLPNIFKSRHQARGHMDILLSKALRLMEQGRKLLPHEESRFGPELLDQQRHLQEDLASWFRAFKASKASSQGRMSPQNTFAYQLLRIYYTMICIMVDVSLSPASERAYDLHTDKFMSMLTQSMELWRIVSSVPIIDEAPSYHAEISKSIVDMGWIPPLYFTAIKCRVRKIRLEAIRLLSLTSHREGIWHSKTATLVARKVMDVEERGNYKCGTSTDTFVLYDASFPSDDTEIMPPVPDSHRVHEVQVTLPGEHKNILLECKQRISDGKWTHFLSEYEESIQSWIDKEPNHDEEIPRV